MNFTITKRNNIPVVAYKQGGMHPATPIEVQLHDLLLEAAGIIERQSELLGKLASKLKKGEQEEVAAIYEHAFQLVEKRIKGDE